MRVTTRVIDCHEDVEPPDHPYIVMHDADPDDVSYVLAGSPEIDDTRSQWIWFRFPNGDLVLGCFPQGDTYFGVADKIGV